MAEFEKQARDRQVAKKAARKVRAQQELEGFDERELKRRIKARVRRKLGDRDAP